MGDNPAVISMLVYWTARSCKNVVTTWKSVIKLMGSLKSRVPAGTSRLAVCIHHLELEPRKKTLWQNTHFSFGGFISHVFSFCPTWEDPSWADLWNTMGGEPIATSSQSNRSDIRWASGSGFVGRILWRDYAISEKDEWWVSKKYAVLKWTINV